MSETVRFNSVRNPTNLDSPNPIRPGRLLIRRQPIYRSNMTEFGYQLLYANADSGPSSQSGGRLLDLFDIGLEELVGGRLGFINLDIDRRSLVEEFYLALPQKSVVLELPDTLESDQDLIQALGELRSQGYRIALGDSGHQQVNEFLLEHADFVRLNIAGKALPAISTRVDELKKYPVQIVGESIETRELFGSCKQLGFDLFQGNFFSAPQSVTGARIPVNRLATLRLVALFNDPRTSIEELEEATLSDPALCYKLFRYVKSAMCSLNRRVESLRHAIVLVGLERIRNWAGLLVFSGFQDAPRAVITTGVVRARMCERLGKQAGVNNSERLFLVGLFSVLDVILEQPLARVLASLPLAADVHDAILYEKGELGVILEQVKAYERADRAQLKQRRTGRLGILLQDPFYMQRVYHEAVEWSLRILRTFEDVE